MYSLSSFSFKQRRSQRYVVPGSKEKITCMCTRVETGTVRYCTQFYGITRTMYRVKDLVPYSTIFFVLKILSFFCNLFYNKVVFFNGSFEIVDNY